MYAVLLMWKIYSYTQHVQSFRDTFPFAQSTMQILYLSASVGALCYQDGFDMGHYE